MKVKSGREKIITACVIAAVFVAAACLCRPVFYLNDDVTMRSILSGSYTGTPDGHAVYMKYPLTLVLSLLYRLAAGFPWMELLFAGCLVWSVTEVIFKIRSKKVGMVLKLLAGILFVLPFFWYMHYTVIAAVLAGTAAFLLGADDGGGKRPSLKPVVFWLLAWMIRSQVAYLAVPFMGVAVMWRLPDIRRRRKNAEFSAVEMAGRNPEGTPQMAVEMNSEGVSGKTARKNFEGMAEKSTGKVWDVRSNTPGISMEVTSLAKTVAAAVLGLLVCMGINHLAYVGEDWQTYLKYNEARTELYDYTNFQSTDYYSKNYEQYGMTESEYLILNSYNTVLDKKLDVEKMAEVAGKVAAGMEDDRNTVSWVKECIRQYYYQIRYSDTLYTVLWLGVYAVLMILLVLGRDWLGLILAGCLGGGRSLIWIFLIYRGRFPERVIISLYIIEILLLIGMLWNLPETCRKNLEKIKQSLSEKWQRVPLVVSICQGVLLLGVICVLTEQVKADAPRTLEQAAVQEEWSTLKEYCSDHEETLYLLDVYSAVEYSDLQYERDAANIMLAGGWMSASPLAEERFESRGAADGGQALYEETDTVFLAEKGRSVEWLEYYLAERFGECHLEVVSEIPCGEDKIFVEYSVVK